MIQRILVFSARDLSQVIDTSVRLRFSTRIDKRRYRYSRQQTYDRDNDHDFNQREAPLIMLFHLRSLQFIIF